MSALVECVPNFSEGCDASIVDEIARAMRREGVYLLDLQMDADHNRSVVTLAGEPEAILASVICGVGKAAELIDLNRHRGVHPRMGATDVLPFVPIRGVTLDECASLARRAGEEIWRRYQIPVYLYEWASPARRDLADIRRGQFEGIRTEIGADPARKPDFGDLRVHPTAGITAVGARNFLIAYNLFLDTEDLNIARQIARAVRSSGGGLPCVKASGFLVRGRAQVSMNLTDFEQTPIYHVFERVQQEAEKYGTGIESSELIGLIPGKALEQAPAWFLKTMDFSPQILETRLSEAIERSRQQCS